MNRTHEPNLVMSFLPVLIVVLILGAYAGTYFALVERDTQASRERDTYLPSYRVGGEYAKVALMPMHSLDLKLRPRHWHNGSREARQKV